LVAPAAAHAEAPFRLPQQITDHSGALDGHTAEVQDALDDLYDRHRVQLWVVYTDSFDGLSGVQWAAPTLHLSGLGADSVLLAVATEDGEYGYRGAVKGLGDSQLSSIASDDIVPKLHADDWPGAAIATAHGLDDALDGPGSAPLIAAVVIMLLIVVGAVVWVRI